MKFLLLLALVAGAVWLFFGRRRRPPPHAKPQDPQARTNGQTQTMLQCAHCGVHLPQPEAKMDAAGRPYCSEAHRLQGPR